MICALCQQVQEKLVQPSYLCSHMFCRECIGNQIKTQLDQERYQILTCPFCNDVEYSAKVVNEYCITRSDTYESRQAQLYVRCQNCLENVAVHNCGMQICFECGDQHQGPCMKRLCKRCYQPIQKTRNNHIICYCKYQFCWICSSKMTKNHYSYWNLWGCPFPESINYNMNPLSRPKLLFFIMIIPKIMAIPFFFIYINGRALIQSIPRYLFIFRIKLGAFLITFAIILLFLLALMIFPFYIIFQTLIFKIKEARSDCFSECKEFFLYTLFFLTFPLSSLICFCFDWTLRNQLLDSNNIFLVQKFLEILELLDSWKKRLVDQQN